MSCPNMASNKLKRKKSEDWEDMELSTPSASQYLEFEFNYKFNEGGCLVDITTGEGFVFDIYESHAQNQQRYEALGEMITDYVYELLQGPDVGLRKLEIPLDGGKKKAMGFIFVSPDFEKKEKLLVLVHGSGVVRAGQWARRLIINDCLDHGTQIPYIRRAIEDGYGVVVLNTNQNEARVNHKGKEKLMGIKECSTPEKHFSYVWKNIIQKTTKATKIFVVAHSYGGYLVVDYFMSNKRILDRVVAVAFTDSVHSLRSQARGEVQQWFQENSVNWVTSHKDVDTPMDYQNQDRKITRVSAGTTKHEETSWKAMKSVFRFFEFNEAECSRSGDKTHAKTNSKFVTESGNNAITEPERNYIRVKDISDGGKETETHDKLVKIPNQDCQQSNDIKIARVSSGKV